MSVKQKIARKAVTKTAKHTANGTVSRLRRDPMRAATLLAIGAVVGVVVGLLAGRAAGGSGGSGGSGDSEVAAA